MRERERHIVDKWPARTKRSTSDMQRSLCDRKRSICEVEKGPHAKPKWPERKSPLVNENGSCAKERGPCTMWQRSTQKTKVRALRAGGPRMIETVSAQKRKVRLWSKSQHARRSWPEIV